MKVIALLALFAIAVAFVMADDEHQRDARSAVWGTAAWAPVWGAGWGGVGRWGWGNGGVWGNGWGHGVGVWGRGWGHGWGHHGW